MGWYRTDLLGSRVAFTDRRGGRSRAPFDSLDLSLSVGDDAGVVEANRRIAGGLLGEAGAPERWVPIRQVHGASVRVCPDGEVPRDRRDADAVVLRRPGPTAVVLTADCAPVVLLARGGAAAVHAGWQGLLGGVVEVAVRALGDAAGPPELALLGPCIRACCYEFGDDDLGRVAARYGDGVRARTAAGAPALDIPAAVSAALAGAGSGERRRPVDVVDLGVCTACSDDYFSHRRDGRRHGTTGRQGVLVTRLEASAR